MNLNLIRSIMTGLAGIIPLVVTFFGCSSDAVTGNVSCSSSWIPVEYSLYLAGALGVASFLIKMFGQGGTLGENLTKPSVVVTPEIKPGTVTETQVQSTK